MQIATDILVRNPQGVRKWLGSLSAVSYSAQQRCIYSTPTEGDAVVR
jgi:hypothetical protein